MPLTKAAVAERRARDPLYRHGVLRADRVRARLRCLPDVRPLYLHQGAMKEVRAWRCRERPYTIIQGFEGTTVKAYSATKALRETRLIPGSKVKVFVPVIVHVKRTKPRGTLLRSRRKIATPRPMPPQERR